MLLPEHVFVPAPGPGSQVLRTCVRSQGLACLFSLSAMRAAPPPQKNRLCARRRHEQRHRRHFGSDTRGGGRIREAERAAPQRWQGTTAWVRVHHSVWETGWVFDPCSKVRGNQVWIGCCSEVRNPVQLYSRFLCYTAYDSLNALITRRRWDS